MAKKIFEIEWEGGSGQPALIGVLENYAHIPPDRCWFKVRELPSPQEWCEKIKEILAQPLDRISHITIEDYGKVRQTILDIINDTNPPCKEIA